MELLWIPISMLAGLCQAVRTAAQKAINARLSTWMTTYIRSLFGLPFMLIYLWVVLSWEGLGAPDVGLAFFLNCLGTATTQVMATYLLIRLFTMSNFAVGTMLTKTDIMQAAIIGSLFFSEEITAIGWLAIIVTVIGVILLSMRQVKGALASGRMSDFLFARSTLTGLGSAFLFCLSYLFLREAALVIEEGSRIYAAAWAMVTVTSIQAVALGAWLVVKEPGEFAKLPSLFKPALFIGLTSAMGSIGWFTAMALQNASYVKAVGQTEVIFTILISVFWFRERITAWEYTGIATIVVAVLLFLV